MKHFLSIISLSISIISFSQNRAIPYSRDYEFTEGVFLTIEQFKQNNPIPKSAIISNVPKNQVDFLTEVLEQKEFIFKDASGNEQKIETQSIWGYCQNRTIYLNFNGTYNRLNVIGTICHFTATVRTVVPSIDPMGFSNSYDELRQFILDTENNKVLDFNVKNMETILIRDNELYAQFMALKKRKKSDSIFIYLRKYNEKHPLYLPAK